MTNERILFERTYLYLMDQNGAVSQISDFLADTPIWSPDGTLIAFTPFDPGTGASGVSVMDAQGGNVRNLYTLGRDHVWSPDGTLIAIGTDNIIVADPDGISVNDVTQYTSATAHTPSWSPNSDKIAYIHRENNNDDIYVINADGTNSTQLTTTGGDKSETRWSPDGNAIAYLVGPLSNKDIYLSNPSGGSPVQLTNTGGRKFRIRWSPDSSLILFSQDTPPSGERQLFVVDTSTGNITQLTSDPDGYYTSFAWSPDGTQIACNRELSGYIDIIEPDGTYVTSLNTGFDSVPYPSDFDWGVQVLNPPNHDGPCGCPATHAGDDCAQSPDPISLRLGEKRETVTDLSVNTPAGPLAFTRSYRQSKHTEYRTMGLGWIHNHQASIDDGVTGKLIVRLPNGGQAHFTQDGTNANRYIGDPGSNSVIEVNSLNPDSHYTLTASDASRYVFDNQKRLRRRQWPNGETWTYSYYTGGIANGLLQAVDDGYGRQLQFAYKDAFGTVQLWRVGDHDTTDLDDENQVDGRYVEFTYVEDKLNGQTTGNNLALLHEVQAVLHEEMVTDHTWTYDWYGQDTGETDSDLANYLLQVTSPPVDTDGDGTPDDSIALKHLTYTLTSGEVSQIEQRRGFVDGELPSTALSQVKYNFSGTQTTEEVIGTGLVTTHNFSAGLLSGSEDPGGNGGSQAIDGGIYRPSGQTDANGNETGLDWSSDGKLLNKVTDALDNETAFTYDSADRLAASLDMEERQTLYAYTEDERQPSQILVADRQPPFDNVDIETEDDWTTINSGTKVWREPQVAAGAYARFVDAPADAGLESASWSLVANRTYIIRAQVYILSGAARLQLSDTTPFTEVADTVGTWTILEASYTPGANETRELQVVADGGAATFYVDQVSVIEDQDLAVNGDMESNSDWTAIGSPTQGQSTTQVDAGTYSWHVDGADAEGIQGTLWDLVADRTYVIMARVYPASGTVKMAVSGETAFDRQSIDTGGWETLQAVYVPTATAH